MLFFWVIIIAVVFQFIIEFKYGTYLYAKLNFILCALPYFAFGNSFMMVTQFVPFTERNINGYTVYNTNWRGILHADLYWMLIEGPFYFCMIFLVEYFKNRRQAIQVAKDKNS